MRLTACLAAFFILFTASAADAQSDPGVDAYKKGDYATAFRLLQPKADAGDPNAQYLVADMYNTGRGVQKDPAQAIAYLRKGVDQGHAKSQFGLAAASLQGSGTPKDVNLAAELARKSADQGDPAGQYLLGTLYLQGAGVSKSIPDAFVWFCLSTTGDNPRMTAEARKICDGLRPMMTPSEVAEGEKRIAAFKPVKQSP